MFSKVKYEDMSEEAKLRLRQEAKKETINTICESLDFFTDQMYFWRLDEEGKFRFFDKWISKGFMKLPKEEVENLYKEARAKGWIK